MQNLTGWYLEFMKEQTRRTNLRAYFLNELNGSNILKLPFVKKLVLTSASATVGDGISLSEPEELDEKQKALYDKITKLFERQKLNAQDKKIVIDGCATGTGYELCYMSDDEEPVPKVAKINSENAFVVFDNTVERNSLYGVYFEKYTSLKKKHVRLYVFDNENSYTADLLDESIATQYVSGVLSEATPHNMGRVPLTKYWNNDAEQADFEPVIDLIADRTTLHDLTLADTKKIVKNILTLINAELAGNTPEQKAVNRDDINELAVLELKSQGIKPAIAQMMSKNESYGMITEFGNDIDSKIYDLTMIPDLTSDTFAGNVTGVALELKLLPFKELVKLKEEQLIALIKRRLKMYAYALTRSVVIDGEVITPDDYEWFDTDDIEITVHRNWTRNVVEIAQMISTLQTTTLFSEEFLTNLMPEADYQVEKERKTVEAEDNVNRQTSFADPNNFSLENLTAQLREPIGSE